MRILKITKGGRVTLPQEILHHLQVEGTEAIEYELLPANQIRLRKVPLTGTIENFIGLLAGRTDKIATLDEIREATRGVRGL